MQVIGFKGKRTINPDHAPKSQSILSDFLRAEGITGILAKQYGGWCWINNHFIVIPIARTLQDLSFNEWANEIRQAQKRTSIHVNG